MSEELFQRNLLKNPPKIGKWDFYNIGNTSLNELKNAGIIPQRDYKVFGKRKPDGIIVSKQKVIAVIENKSISKFKTDTQKQQALKQGIDVAKILNARILILTDTIETIWINCLSGKKIQDESGCEFKYVFVANDEKLPEILNKIVISINEENDQIKSKNEVNPTDLAKQIWQDIWSVSGATPENCLYTFVELFIFKYLSDLGILHGVFSFHSLLKNYSDNDKEEMLEYYAGTIRPKIKELFKENPVDKTTIINGTIFVSKDQKAVKGYSSVFKKILDKFDKYGKLEYIDRDFKSQLFESFLKESISKKNWGQFFTPLKVVRAIIKMAESDITKDKIICDPACGVGKFLLEAVISRLNYFYEVKDGKIKNHITICGFDKGFDKDEQKTIILAKANMLIYFSDIIKENSAITNEFSDLFNKTFELKTNSILGTLSEPVKDKYDIILTNPPYVTSGSSNLKDEINKDEAVLKPHYKISGIGVEGLFMEWIIRALKPGGKAFIVVPDGLFNRQNDKNLRQFILNECIVDSIISLPLKTFFTTQKKTYILCITKKDGGFEKQNDPVFTYLVSEIGESRDNYRFPIVEDDLSEAVSCYNQFKNAKRTYKSNDLRCKIQPFEKLVSENNWNIERWWQKDEEIALGITEEDKTIKIEDFPNLLEEIASNVLSYKEDILLFNEKNVANIFFDDKHKTLSIKEVFIGDIFDFPSTNSRITKEFCNNNQGNIPVYASSKDEEAVLGHIKDNMSNIKYYENCLSWNRNGSVGYVFIRNHKFTTNEDHRAFIIKQPFHNNLSKEYLKFTIENSLLKGGFSFLNKCGLDKIKKVKIPVPVTKDGDFDLIVQKKIAEKYHQINQAKINILKELNKIESTVIDIM